MAARGASRGQLLMLTIVQAVIVGAAHRGLGAVARARAYAGLAAQPAMIHAGMPRDSGLPASGWLYAAIVALLFVVVLIAPQLGRADTFVEAEQSKGRQRRGIGLIRSGLDLGVTLLAVILYWQLLTLSRPGAAQRRALDRSGARGRAGHRPAGLRSREPSSDPCRSTSRRPDRLPSSRRCARAGGVGGGSAFTPVGVGGAPADARTRRGNVRADLPGHLAAIAGGSGDPRRRALRCGCPPRPRRPRTRRSPSARGRRALRAARHRSLRIAREQRSNRGGTGARQEGTSRVGSRPPRAGGGRQNRRDRGRGSRALLGVRPARQRERNHRTSTAGRGRGAGARGRRRPRRDPRER